MYFLFFFIVLVGSCLPALMYFHVNFWMERHGLDVEEQIAFCLLSIALFPIIGIVEAVRFLKPKAKKFREKIKKILE